ncbi:hypothetical protein LCGC14_1369420 [marine sediment metagenome]|uniref:Uncharacterized protein n=1 Tax=marine sediment metagenome TaxID=412755 RepID=A0A0F9K669_9ZZZZ
MEYQKCPVCNGAGQVSGGFFNRAGDGDSWISADSLEKCRVCNGKGIIIKPEMEPAEESKQ